jgi:hypothetical protein
VVSIWVDDTGVLHTDPSISLHDGGWQRLKEIRKKQSRAMTEKTQDGLSVVIHSTYLYAAVKPRSCTWTMESPRNFACQECTQSRRICFRSNGGRLEALPLAGISEHTVDRIDDVFVTEEGEKIRINSRNPGIWR